MIETICKQFWNSQVIIYSRHGMLNLYTHFRAYQIKLWPKLNYFIRCNCRYIVYDIYNLKIVLLDATIIFKIV